MMQVLSQHCASHDAPDNPGSQPQKFCADCHSDRPCPPLIVLAALDNACAAEHREHPEETQSGETR